jgi:hypothetical protein
VIVQAQIKPPVFVQVLEVYRGKKAALVRHPNGAQYVIRTNLLVISGG